MRLRPVIILALLALSCRTPLPQTGWYVPVRENRPFVRWWWLGSAVDSAGLSYNLEEFARAGIGGVEVTPIYGVLGNEDRNLSYLSPEWMQAWRYTAAEADRLGLEADLNGGTGWPFGGPQIPEFLVKNFAERPRFRCAALALSRCAPAGPLKYGMAYGHCVPSVPFRCPELMRASSQRSRHQKSTAAVLRCHSLICGETEIRTRDTLLAYTRFPGVPLKPLEHLSRLNSRKNGTAKIVIF